MNYFIYDFIDNYNDLFVYDKERYLKIYSK